MRACGQGKGGGGWVSVVFALAEKGLLTYVYNAYILTS